MVLDKEAWKFRLQSLKFRQILILKSKLAFCAIENVSCIAVMLLSPLLRPNLRKSLSFLFFFSNAVTKGDNFTKFFKILCNLFKNTFKYIHWVNYDFKRFDSDTTLPVDLCLSLRLKSYVHLCWIYPWCFYLQE